MKHISYCFSDADIEVITFTLSILPDFDFGESEVQAEINYQCCLSAGSKLIERSTDITPNEFRVILASLEAAQLITRGELDADPETKKKCNSYLFTINKLVSVFDEQLS